MPKSSYTNRSSWIVVAIAACVAPAAFGKNPNYQADMTAPHTWADNHIAVVQVQFPGGNTNPSEVLLTRIMLFTEGETPQNWTVPIGSLSFGINNDVINDSDHEKKPKLKSNDLLLVVIPQKQKFTVIPAILISAPAEKNEMVQSLKEIAALRKVDTLAAYETAIGSSHELAVLYGARQLLAKKDFVPPPDFIRQLQAWRNEKKSSPLSQIAINEILLRSARKELQTDVASWLKKSISENVTLNAEQLYPFIDQLLPLMSTRDDRINLFTTLLNDKTKVVQTRLAASGTLTRKDCFDYSAPTSPSSKTVFAALTTELESSEGILRKSASSMLEEVCSKIPTADDRQKAVKEAKQAVTTAIAKEKDPDVLSYLKAYLWHLEQVP